VGCSSAAHPSRRSKEKGHARCNGRTSAASEMTWVRSEGRGGSFPGLEYTVGEAVASPHQSKEQEKYCSPPEAAHERAGTPALG
jgi:hypothetical protein